MSEMQLGKGPRISRADLIRMLCKAGPQALAECSDLFGYKAPEPEEDEPTAAVQPLCPQEFVPFPQSEPPSKETHPRSKQRLLRLRERLRPERDPEAGAPEWMRNATPFSGSIASSGRWSRSTARPPALPPLSSWPRLWPFLRAALGQAMPCRELDVDRIVRSLAEGRPLLRLPHRLRLDWAPAAQVVVDFDLGLHCFWQDFHGLTEQLVRLRGRFGLELLCLAEGPLGPCADLRPERRNALRPWRLPAPGVPVLILGDLGQFDGRTEEWLVLGRRFKQAGRRRPVVLMPCPERRWRDELSEFFVPVVWDHGRRLPRQPGARLRRPVPPSFDKAQVDPGLEDLLAMAVAAVRVEPGLLRSLRMLLPSGRADVGTEAAVWRHGAVEADLLSFRLRQDALEAHAHRLRDKLRDPAELLLFRAAFERIAAFHVGLPPEIRFEESLSRSLLLAEEPMDRDALEFMQQAAATVVRATDAASYPYRPHLEAWVQRLAKRQIREYWSSDEGKPMAAAFACIVDKLNQRGCRVDPPPGLDLGHFAWVLDSGSSREIELRWETELRLKTGRLVVRSAGEEPRQKSDLAMVRVKQLGSCLQWRHRGAQDDSVQTLHFGAGSEIPLPDEGELEVWGSFGRLVLDDLALAPPAWAANVAQGRWPSDGREYLVLTTKEPHRKSLCWLPPGPFPVVDLSGRSVDKLWLEQGFFVVQDEAEELLAHGFRQPPWAKSIGVDEHGLHADLEIRGVVQQFRWIQPGSFLMGSPEDEPERYNDEGPQHEVVLTESFWLAETACTQQLWQAVVGSNPSEFKGPLRPVEQVGWDDVQEFLKRLNQMVPSLDACLPTEAQWEHACRAGTTTPFSFGSRISTDQANFDGNQPYAGGPKGIYRVETVDVYALPGNLWGLRQMHGNVWEWCQDFYGPYADSTVVDPVGPASGSDRVVRGGSWLNGGRNCRSAYRNWYEPADRIRNIGFRLARGRTK